VPDGVQHIEIVDRVRRGDHDAIAGCELELLAQRAGEPGDTAGKLGVAADRTTGQADSRPGAVTAPGTIEPQREVHRRSCQSTNGL
jgi:hypothetical protein